MEKTTGRSRRYMITKNSILVLVMLVIVFLAIWAWYANVTQTTASTTVISAGDSDNVELAVPERVTSGESTVDSFPHNNSSWKAEISFNDTAYFKNLVKDVTSNGEQFVVPNFEAAQGLEKGRKVIPDDVWISGLSSKEALTNEAANDDDQYHYVSLDFYMRSKSKGINLKGSSYLAAQSECDNKPLVKSNGGSDIERPSTYGPDKNEEGAFSADALVGAMRVSILGAPVSSVSNSGNIYSPGYAAGVSETLRFVWLPRPDIYLKADDEEDNWRLFTGIKPSGNSAAGSVSAATIDNYANETYAHNFYKGKYVVPNDPTSVKKGLDKTRYFENSVKPYSGETGVTVTDPGNFMVSKITSLDTNVGTTGYIPTLNQTFQNLVNDGSDDSKNINFTRDDNTDLRAISGYYVYKMTLNIWIEGEDAEARRSMKDGEFKLYLEFGT